MTDQKDKAPLQNREPTGTLIKKEGEWWYRISRYDTMEPFFISIVSGSDHWLFLSSSGGITAGRKDSDLALFPYYTEDKITDSPGSTGSLTHFKVTRQGEQEQIWSPFDPVTDRLYRVERNLYKSIYGDKIWFEEINHDLGLLFRYGWMTGDRFGIIRESHLETLPDTPPCRISICDGLRNILPYGAFTSLQNDFSSLLDAYKRSELETESKLALFHLSSLLTDRAEPSECLRTNTFFALGLTPSAILLSTRQVDSFLQNRPVTTETDIRGTRGAYLIITEIPLSPGEGKTWLIAGDCGKDHAQVTDLVDGLSSGRITEPLLREDIQNGTVQLCRYVALSDGIQVTGNRIGTIHHFANVMFNIMRGGIFASEYRINVQDFQDFLKTRNHQKEEQYHALLSSLPEQLHRSEMAERITAYNDTEIKRLFLEYLPLSFSRRHGDPSRPWNRFSIVIKNDNGQPRLNYQGNWRDIFQNWEALALSFPQYLDGMITRFLCATTADGYNPYRVTRDGFDWEVPEPHNPWSNIGYWQDHQIIYLEKLLELYRDHYPGQLEKSLSDPIYSHARVPYKIKPYREICENYRDTIIFDHHENEEIDQLVRENGTDGKLLPRADGSPLRITMIEKILTLLLAKLINFVPGGGLWLNTQRPEWNDANNALVGPGLSIVTLAYLRRFVLFISQILEDSGEPGFQITAEVGDYFRQVLNIFRQMPDSAHTDNRERKRVMDRLGETGSRFREKIYQTGFTGQTVELSTGEILSLCREVVKQGDKTLGLNKRADGLYHSYNLLEWDSGEGASIRYLYEMLEGQVAVLSSGYLTPEEASQLLDLLKKSALYREDQRSYILYPNRELPRFLNKNTLPGTAAEKIPLLKKLIQDKNPVILHPDRNGDLHFHPDLRNGEQLEKALEELARIPRYKDSVRQDQSAVLALYEEHFHHISFTGRSGTFFAYEGLGSIYWHMVAKLLLACRENADRASGKTREILLGQYREIRSGIGYYKSPAQYGAFPTDPYSHTPAHTGARQPGMTGQVKEEVITRRLELGITVSEGRIKFNPETIESQEFLSHEETVALPLAEGKDTIHLQPESLLITLYRIPVRFIREKVSGVTVILENGTERIIEDYSIPADISRAIFDGTPVPDKNSPVKEIVVRL